MPGHPDDPFPSNYVSAYLTLAARADEDTEDYVGGATQGVHVWTRLGHGCLLVRAELLAHKAQGRTQYMEKFSPTDEVSMTTAIQEAFIYARAWCRQHDIAFDFPQSLRDEQETLRYLLRAIYAQEAAP
jgi:hypothetical protein